MTRDDIIKLGREAGFRIGPSRSGPDDVWGVGATLERFAALVMAQERDAIAEAVSQSDPRATPKGIAAAIRARREQ